MSRLWVLGCGAEVNGSLANFGICAPSHTCWRLLKAEHFWDLWFDRGSQSEANRQSHVRPISTHAEARTQSEAYGNAKSWKDHTAEIKVPTKRFGGFPPQKEEGVPSVSPLNHPKRGTLSQQTHCWSLLGPKLVKAVDPKKRLE